MPNRGYGSPKATKGMELNGKYNIVINNMSEMEALVMKHRKYNVVLAGCMGGKLRAQIVEKAQQMGLKISNERTRNTIEEYQ